MSATIVQERDGWRTFRYGEGTQLLAERASGEQLVYIGDDGELWVEGLAYTTIVFPDWVLQALLEDHQRRTKAD